MNNTLKTYLKHISTAVFAAFLVTFSAGAFAQEHGEHTPAATHTEETGNAGETEKGEELNIGKLIFDHILDSHDWHIAGSHHHPIYIPLPVILYTDKGLDVFMSSRFYSEGHIAMGEHYAYKINEETGKVQIVEPTGEHEVTVNEAATAKLWDISITKNAFAILFSVVLIIFVFLPIAKKYQKNPNRAPSGMQSLLEPIILFIINDIAIPNIGKKKYEKFLPFLLTVFFFLLTNNLLGLIPFFPGGANVTGNIAIPLTLAGIVLVIIILSSNKHFWTHMLAMPGVPKPVLLILTPIEILGFVIRPFVLMMRLFANITAGHIVILSFVSLIFVFGSMNAGAGYGASIFSMLLVIFMSLLELLVAFLQAYVFTLLSAIYFGSAVEEGHHHEEAHH